MYFSLCIPFIFDVVLSIPSYENLFDLLFMLLFIVSALE